MAKTSGELEKEFIDSAKEKTGKSLEQWLSLVKSSGIEKRNDIISWLKKDHGLNHMQAQFVIGIHLNDGNPVYINESNLLETHFVKFPEMCSLFDAIAEKIISEFTGTQVIPKKTYLSLNFLLRCIFKGFYLATLPILSRYSFFSRSSSSDST